MKGSNVTSTLDKYQRVQAPKESNENTSKNDIRITHKQRINGYIVYATNLLIKDKEDYVILKAAGNAAPKGVLVAEILRNRVPGLHQINKIVNVEVVDKWIPLEEGLDTVIDTKILPVLEIKLTTKPSPEELKDPSYQAPLPADQVQEVDLESLQRGKRRGQPRGGEETKQGEGEGRPRGERNQGRRGGRGGRGGQRGGNNDDWENDDEVFKQDPPFSNRNDGPREGGQRRGQGNQGRRGYRGRGGNRGGNRGVRLGDSMGLREDNNYGGSKYQGDKYEDERYDDRDRRQGGGRRQGGNQGWDNRDLRRDDGYGRKAQGDAFREERRDNQGRGGDNQGRGGDRRQGGGRGNQGYQGNEGNRRPQTRRDDEGEWGDYDRPPRNQDRNRGQGYRDQRDQGDEREERGFRGAPRGRGRGRGRGGVGQNWVTKT